MSQSFLTGAHALNALSRMEVVRWVGHPACRMGQYRTQTTSDHRGELLMLLQSLLIHLHELEIRPDSRLLMSAIWHHDDGEDFGFGDTLYTFKRQEHDLAEYQIFVKHVQPVVSDLEWRHLQRAFLLQFVQTYAESELFPQEARAVMQELQQTRSVEAMIFGYLERLDYLLYAVEQAQVYGNPHFVREVFPNQRDRLDVYIREWPALRGFYWPDPLRPFCQKIVDELGELQIRQAA